MVVYGLKIDGSDGVDGCTDGVYLDGELEDINGFDLLYIPDLPESEGIYPCEVQLCGHDKKFMALLFFWKYRYNAEWVRNRGLVVKYNDTEAQAHARKMYAHKTSYL